MDIVVFRFGENDVICKFVEELDKDKVDELCDSIQSYMNGVVGDDNYDPIDVMHTVLSESDFGNCEICYPHYVVTVE